MPDSWLLVAAIALVVCTGVVPGAAGASHGPSGPDTMTTTPPAIGSTAPTSASDFDPSCLPAPSDPDAVDTETAPVDPRIVELYPNPTTDHNVGEYLTLEVPPDTTLENWTVTDGHTTAEFPDETASGRVAVSTDPNVTETLTDDPVLELEGTIRLAVDGDDLELRNGTEIVDAVSYEDAPTAERWHRESDHSSVRVDGSQAASTADGVAVAREDGDWIPRDGTCFPVSNTTVDETTTFVLPDAPEVPRETLRAADDRLLLAGYTITSTAIADDLIEAADRGVDVAVLFESGPVGGTPEATVPVLETLEDGGVDVRVIGGEGARYRFHHPKYAVADDTAVVTSENWKPSGVGGTSSRGWGVRVEDSTLAADLERVFRADFEGWDTQSSESFRETTTFVDDESETTAREPLPSEHEPRTVRTETVELLLAPDNAEDAITDHIRAADDEILIKQASIAADATVLAETLAAARRGVDVRILLDSTWYHEDDNVALRDDLQAAATVEDLPLEVELVEETDRFEKIHAKGVVIDGEIAVVGSANWNQNAFENNREVMLTLHGEEAAGYYVDVFENDWNTTDESPWTLPFELSLTVLAALVVAAVVGYRYIRFGSQRDYDEIE
ncbi:phospholipase [Salinadaptatus halalkaliphilus]|uniref:Phospholipase n=1 Tax=Salinadaptatus halalkaliphilus TaxID=2419781 RepID=A0A4S3TRD2_9EURY|nr:phospholipase D-like domain-containing protein [Salinadaptatus halalkaliphilus]THE65875.1 phospholipase [Salinadaptatus halalkaliphilus]